MGIVCIVLGIVITLTCLPVLALIALIVVLFYAGIFLIANSN